MYPTNLKTLPKIWRATIASLLILVTVAMAADLRLSVLGREKLTCPLCRKPFETVICAQSNTRGGVDRDLFARALGPQPEFYRISTCPRCGYSGYESDFNAEVLLPPDVKEKFLQRQELQLPTGFNEKSDPRELDASIRYNLAIQSYRWRGKSDESLAWLHLRAAWIAREEGSVLPPDARLKRVMAFVQRWRPDLPPHGNQADIELQLAGRIAEEIATGRFNRYQQPYVELALAMILRQHGENRIATPLLDRAVQYEPFSVDLHEAITRMKQSILLERQHQEAAVEYFEHAVVADQISPENRGPAHYLLGELCRRLGRERESTDWFARAAADTALPQQMRLWLSQQQSTQLKPTS